MPNKSDTYSGQSPKMPKKAKNKPTPKAGRSHKANTYSGQLPIIPKPPKYFNGYSKEKWEELAPVFIEKNMLSQADLSAFELLCRHYGDAMDLYEAMVDKYGSLANYFVDRNSQTMGEYLAYHKAISSYTKMLIEFGLTPAAKKKVPIPEIITEEDTLTKMLNE
ncbi:P27 family phage terminase small subunit [Brachyspira aalborgi]|jgi:P27 family predicted phage terminase small subunit|nr:P27 family phage terminase small subunit [Brachyspira aalborgi]DAT28548.1 MAG TPA: terminase small subunit [Caudoviricetes sp.]